MISSAIRLHCLASPRLSVEQERDAMKLVRRLTLAIVVVGATIAVCSSGLGVRAPALMRFVAPNYPSGANSAVSEKVTAFVTVNADEQCET